MELGYWFITGALIIATIFDLWKKIVPNGYSMSLILISLFVRYIESQQYNFEYFFNGLIGGLLFFGIGYLMWSFDSFGAGDAKILTSVGIFLPGLTRVSIIGNSFLFMIIFLIAGGIYFGLWKMFTLSKKELKMIERKKLLKEGELIPFTPGILLSWGLFWLIQAHFF